METKNPKTPNYVQGEEAELLIEKIETEIETLKAERKAIEDNYITSSSNNASSKKIAKISNKAKKVGIKIQRLELDLLKLQNGKFVKLTFIQKIQRTLRNMPYNKQKTICGLLFLLPWIIGFCLFFAKPLLTTIYWSFFDVTTEPTGLKLEYIGTLNYINLFESQMLDSRTFIEVLTVSLEEMLLNVPIILIFSLIVAVVLNTKFKGHQIFKAIFFIPVVYNSAIINTIMNGAFGSYASGNMDSMASLLDNFSAYLMQIGLAEGLISFLISAVDRIFTIINMSGIQILIFIAALQSIPKNLYEAAKVEGATTYECFWKITFPMVSPMFLPVIIYSIVDSMASSDLINFMTKVSSSVTSIGYGMSSTIAVVYFLVILVVIVLVFVILKAVVYDND